MGNNPLDCTPIKITKQPLKNYSNSLIFNAIR